MRLNHLHIHSSIRNTSQEGLGRIYAAEVNKSITNIAEEAHYHEFQSGYIEAYDKLKSVLVYFVKKVLTEIAERATFVGMLELSIEKWTNSSIFEKLFINRALKSTWFVGPVENVTVTKTKVACNYMFDQIEFVLGDRQCWERFMALPFFTTNFRIRIKSIRGRESTQTCDG